MSDFSSLGLLAMLMQRASTVGGALRSLERHLHLLDRGAVVQFTGKTRRGLAW